MPAQGVGKISVSHAAAGILLEPELSDIPDEDQTTNVAQLPD